MAALAYVSPRLPGVPGIDSTNIRSYSLAQGAAFREGDVLQLITTGTIVTPNPTGSTLGPNVPGPTSSAITLGTTTASGAPAATYYILLTYTLTSNESATSLEQVVNVPAGYVPTVNVASAGAPAGATNYAAYIGLYPGGETLQQATRTTTALGTAFTTPYPLTNNQGVNEGATNPSASIVGIALQDSAAMYATGVGGSYTAGGLNQVLGAQGGPPPLTPLYPWQALVGSLLNSQPLEISLKQAWYPSLQGTTVGLTYDTASGWWIADNSVGNNTIASIQSKVVAPDAGGPGDTGARVVITFQSAVI